MGTVGYFVYVLFLFELYYLSETVRTNHGYLQQDHTYPCQQHPRRWRIEGTGIAGEGAAGEGQEPKEKDSVRLEDRSREPDFETGRRLY